MKSNTKKRLIAFMLCMVLVLSSATSVFADEPQNTDSQSQTEAVTEPAADEATGDEAAVNSSEQQQQQEEQQPETESTPEGNLENDISIQTTINGTTITMSGPYSSFPEGSNYEILASELNEEETKNVEVALKKKEDEINTKIATYKAYDIKLLVDGIESQPTGNVNVKFEGGEVQETLETAENIEVYHVDETTQIANDIEKTAVDDTVTMTTNHFSTYVITTTQQNGVDITVQHYIKYTDSNNQTAEKALYRDSTIHLAKDQQIEDLSSLQNYTSQKVIKINADGSEGDEISNRQVITDKQTYRVYYTPTTATSNEDVQMFDYQVKGENNASINADKNYDSHSTKTTRFASGLANNQYSGNGYDTTIKINNQDIHINTWDTNSNGTKVNQYNNDAFGRRNAMTDIVKGVDFNTGALKMGVNSDGERLYEPGFFTTAPKSGKQVLAGYKLNFSRNGDTYTLTGVNKPDGNSALTNYSSDNGSNFFPLDSIRDLHKDEANNPSDHNCFFGMRYDIEFTIGDYLGDLNYSFTGDDDLWAILDANKDGGQVVIDLGGIHSALDKKVDLWEILLNKKDYKEEDKLKYADRDKKHTLTILYMERGAYESNCKMNFTLPNSRIVTPSTIPTADLTLKKVNTSEEGIANTTFKLVNDANSSDVKIAKSNPAGNITFTELREGTYTLSEESVPEPYVRETSTWKVKVTKSEGTALTAVLYDSTGETAKEKNAADDTYHIVNSTQEEVVSGSAESDKTVSVKDYKARTYQIDLTASSKATQAVNTVASNAVTYASDIKRDYKADIYSLGIFDAANSNGNLSGASIATINKFMTDVASDSSKYMTADSVDSLYHIFNSITDNMPVSITATITDVIDSRFELTTGEKERLEVRGATVTTLDGITTVTWTNTTVNSKTGNTPGWHETIEIKAKDDFIGGNMIPTNGSDSGITVGNNKKPFPQPSVNVKLLTPSIGNKEITYYKGDTIESSKFSGELLGTYKMTELDKTTTVEKGIPQSTKEQLTKLKNGETVEVPYSYTNSNTDIEGTFVYEYRNKTYEAEGTKVNPLKDHPATKVGKDVEEYELTVTFVPKIGAERKDSLKDTAVLEPNSNENISGTVVTTASVTGTYKVHVLALWAIVKQSTSTGSDGKRPMLSGAKFELVKDSKVCYTGESNSDGFVEWYKAGTKVSLSEIEKATYTLRETSAPAGYAKSKVQWTIAITDTTVTITGANENTLTPTQLENSTTGKKYDAYTYENTPVYDLPSTGGTGIYLYMIGGMLLMFAAVWILYKNKCKEVLEK